MRIARRLIIFAILLGFLIGYITPWKRTYVLAQNIFATINLTATWTAIQNFAAGLTTSSVNGIINVDGMTYSKTCAGIKSAIAAAPTGGNAAGTQVVVGPGDIPCNTTILIDKPITLRMSAESGRIVPQAGFAGPVIKMFKDANSVVNQYGQAIGMKLENVWIEDTAFRSQATDGIWIQAADEVTFQNVEVKWLKGYGLRAAARR